MVPSRCRARTDDTNKAANIAPPHNMRSPRPSGLQLLKNRKQASVELRSSRQQSRVTFQSLWSARHPTQTQHSNARRERETTEPLLLLREESCDNAQQLRTGSTHDMQSNFCCVMWIKTLHTPDDLLLCWRRVPRCPIHMRVATIVPCIRHKFRNRSPAVDSWLASCFWSLLNNKIWSHRCG